MNKKYLIIIMCGLIVICFIGTGVVAILSDGDNKEVTYTLPTAMSIQETLVQEAVASNIEAPTPEVLPMEVSSVGMLGERIEKQGIAITILSATKTNTADFIVPSDGNIYLVIDVVIENVNRDEETPYNLLYFSVKDGNGYQYQTTFFSPDPSLLSGSLIKGDKVRGFVAFEVQNVSTSYVVTYEPLVILGGYEPIRIDLGTLP